MHLAEVAGRGEVVVQAAVGDQEHLAARDLAIEHPADVHAGFADEVAAELDDELAPAAARAAATAAQLRADRAPIGARSSGCSPGK